MKNDATSPKKLRGPDYWRSLEHLTASPKFQQWAEREFPETVLGAPDGKSRRDFMKIMGASFLLGGMGLTGCRRPEEALVPFSKMPHHYTHGVAQYFATSMPVRNSAIPLLVKSSDGRPTKVEGNPDVGECGGGTDSFAQASLLNLYDPDRSRYFIQSGKKSNLEDAEKNLAEISNKHKSDSGRGLHFLVQSTSSPSRIRLEKLIKKSMPEVKWCVYDPIDFEGASRGYSEVFGRSIRPVYHFDKAKVIFSLDCDFLGTEQDSSAHIHGYTKGRKVRDGDDGLATTNRLYSVESMMSLTGSNADHRFRVTSSQVFGVAAAMMDKCFEALGSSDEDAGSPIPALRTSLRDKSKEIPEHPSKTGFSAKWIEEAVQDLIAHKGSCLIVAGQRQPDAVHQLVAAMNTLLGNVNRTVSFIDREQHDAITIEELKLACDAEEVETLVILDGNPVYDAPADLEWKTAQRKAKHVIRLGYYEDETSQDVDWHLPMTHYLESWGDNRSSKGYWLPVQPLIAPLFKGFSEIELLSRLAGQADTKGYEIARSTLRAIIGDSDFEAQWKQCLHDGHHESLKTQIVSLNVQTFDWSKLTLQIGEAITDEAQFTQASKDALEVVFHRDASMDDGRFHNNGWMQECPDPITKITWDNAILMSRRTAVELGDLKNEELIEVNLEGRKLTGPVWIQPGYADFSLGMALGYGRPSPGRVGSLGDRSVGYNAYSLRGTTSKNFTVGGTVKRLNKTFPLACTQDHWSMEGRAIVREANLENYETKRDFAQNMDLEAHSAHIPHDVNGQPKQIYKHPYTANPETKSEIHQWGMAIDLNTCVGCTACVVACQSENNIPIVGKDQVANSREMHWVRIDRYYSGEPAKRSQSDNLVHDDQQAYEEWIDDVQVVHMPMSCQHCESAPCESVCPVNATVHDHEGLNVMAYNRCVGTRYCSNNCAYKVRRFNYFDYNKRPLDKLDRGPWKTFVTEGFAERPQDEVNLVEMAKNPDVTVRMRGVMEKCTYCTQKIEAAKIAQKIKARDSGDIEVPDGTIKAACQEACPADSVSFGNLLDPNSKVSIAKRSPRNYSVLGFLDTKPRTTYLAKLRNPNKKMPDYFKMPLSTLEYEREMGSPFESHGHHTHEDSHGDHGHNETHASEDSGKGGQH